MELTDISGSQLRYQGVNSDISGSQLRYHELKSDIMEFTQNSNN